MRSRSQCRNASAGSTPTTSGTDAIGRGPRSQAASRTASFSVVSTSIDADASASAAMRLTSRAVNGWWSRNSMMPEISQPTDRMSATKRSGLAMPVTTNTWDPDGTTTESRGSATLRGAPMARVTRNTGEIPKARPIRSAAVS